MPLERTSRQAGHEEFAPYSYFTSSEFYALCMYIKLKYTTPQINIKYLLFLCNTTDISKQTHKKSVIKENVKTQCLYMFNVCSSYT